MKLQHILPSRSRISARAWTLYICSALFFGACSNGGVNSAALPSRATGPASFANVTAEKAAHKSWYERLFGGERTIYSESGSLVLSFQLPPKPQTIQSAAGDSAL